MTTDIKPLILWGGVLGPNPSKVSIILDSLDNPHEAVYVAYDKIKDPEYIKINLMAVFRPYKTPTQTSSCGSQALLSNISSRNMILSTSSALSLEQKIMQVPFRPSLP